MKRNYLVNGGFDVFDAACMSGCTTDAAAEISGKSSRWFVGPGHGGTCKWQICDFDGEAAIDGNPRHYLHLEWLTAPTQGEQPPSQRFTFLENHGCRDARQLHDCWVDMTWWLRLASGTIAVIPIVWSNFTEGDYKIHSGEAYPVRAEKGWHALTQSIFVPRVAAGKVIDTTSYVGFGLDFLALYGPTIDIACAAAYRKTVELPDPQIERVRATGDFWGRK